VVGWIVGPQSKGFTQLTLGNDGYNLFAWIFVLFINVIFGSFLTFKGLLIQELTQFIAYLSPRQSGMLLWEQWRRSPLSASKRTRFLHGTLLAAPPFAISILILTLLGHLLSDDSTHTTDRINSISMAASSTPQALAEAARHLVSTADVRHLLHIAWGWWWAVLILHIIPIYFVLESIAPVNKIWRKIGRSRPELPEFNTIRRLPFLDDPSKTAGHARLTKHD